MASPGNQSRLLQLWQEWGDPEPINQLWEDISDYCAEQGLGNAGPQSFEIINIEPAQYEGEQALLIHLHDYDNEEDEYYAAMVHRRVYDDDDDEWIDSFKCVYFSDLHPNENLYTEYD